MVGRTRVLRLTKEMGLIKLGLTVAWNGGTARWLVGMARLGREWGRAAGHPGSMAGRQLMSGADSAKPVSYESCLLSVWSEKLWQPIFMYIGLQEVRALLGVAKMLDYRPELGWSRLRY